MPNLLSTRGKKMADTSITHNAVLKVLRQIKADATTAEQNGIWDYIITKASTQSRGNIAKAIAAGGDRARSSVAKAVKEWRGMLFLKSETSQPNRFLGDGRGGKKQQPQQGQQPKQSQQEKQTQPQRQQQRQQQNTATGKGRGAQLAAGPRASDAGAHSSTRSSSAAKGAQRKNATAQRTPWAELIVGAETPLLLPSGEVAAKCELDADDSQENSTKPRVT